MILFNDPPQSSAKTNPIGAGIASFKTVIKYRNSTQYFLVQLFFVVLGMVGAGAGRATGISGHAMHGRIADVSLVNIFWDEKTLLFHTLTSKEDGQAFKNWL